MKNELYAFGIQVWREICMAIDKLFLKSQYYSSHEAVYQEGHFKEVTK